MTNLKRNDTKYIDNKFPEKHQDFDNDSVSLRTRSVNFNLYNVYLYEFGPASELTDLFNIIQTSEEHDEIKIHLNNPGGSIDAGIQLCNSILNKGRGKLEVLVQANIYSMAALFTCFCLNNGIPLTLFPNTFIMFHDYYNVMIGKGHEITAMLYADQKHFKQLLIDYCHPFLTKVEINNIMAGKDLYITQVEAYDRINKIIDKKSKK